MAKQAIRDEKCLPLGFVTGRHVGTEKSTMFGIVGVV
jgi:hypothetical protein